MPRSLSFAGHYVLCCVSHKSQPTRQRYARWLLPQHGNKLLRRRAVSFLSPTEHSSLVQTSYDEPAGPNIADSVAWQDLSSHVPEIEQTHLKTLLKDQKRTDMLSAESEGVYADFSRQRVTSETLRV